MRIVLINSPLQNYENVKKQDYHTTPPIGLGSLATVANTTDEPPKLDPISSMFFACISFAVVYSISISAIWIMLPGVFSLTS